MINGEEKSPLQQKFRKKMYQKEASNPIAWDTSVPPDEDGGINPKCYGNSAVFSTGVQDTQTMNKKGVKGYFRESQIASAKKKS